MQESPTQQMSRLKAWVIATVFAAACATTVHIATPSSATESQSTLEALQPVEASVQPVDVETNEPSSLSYEDDVDIDTFGAEFDARNIIVEEEPVAAEPLPYTEDEVIRIVKTLDGEWGDYPSDYKRAAVVWCILNRVDSELYPNTITEVVTRGQFHGYRESNPVDEHLEWLVRDVLDRWVCERNGETDVGRSLPKEYLYFYGDGWENHFTVVEKGKTEWDWSLPNPYDT